jgi:hypothetical protein
MIRKSGDRFSEKIILKQSDETSGTLTWLVVDGTKRG